MGYDYSSYRSQIDAGKDRYPVITVVLNFSDKRWNKPVNLKNLLAIPEGMENFVQDYKINVFDIAFLPDETINKFKSTFKHVAHFLNTGGFLIYTSHLAKKLNIWKLFLIFWRYLRMTGSMQK